MAGNGIIVLFAFVLDLLLGDPVRPTHPVVLIGRLITFWEKILYGLFKSPSGHRLAGVSLWIFTVPTVYLVTSALVEACYKINFWLGFVSSVWLVYTSIAVKNLADEALAILSELERGDIKRARIRLGGIVGRDTERLPVAEICRATVETVAENTVDGIISPLFYAFIGGPALALAFKAVSTLDSMVGYRNERYINFGWFSAKMDDILNYVPARLGGILIVAAAFLMKFDGKGALRTMLKDAGKHKSPNAGIPEAAFAGALGLRLGGWNSYSGILHFCPYMGENKKDLSLEDIRLSVNLSICTALLGLISGEVILNLL
ncbi:MAG: adenosylcobinamide-phosphate synthase CbiB [Bacillota bacterium]|nr:MAG: cobalamin biosynthesis protein CobD [Bacillota bacterium]